MFVPIITLTNQTPKVRLVSLLSRIYVGNLGKPVYPPNFKVTDFINKNSLLDFGIHVDYSARSSLKERKGSEFKVPISVGARTTYPHFFLILKSPRICTDLRGFPIGVWGEAAPPCPPPRGDAYGYNTWVGGTARNLATYPNSKLMLR